MIRFVKRWRWTISAVVFSAVVIAILAKFVIPNQPWYYLPVRVGGVMLAVLINEALKGRRKRARASRDAMFPGGKPCPPECRIQVPHFHG